MILVDANLLLYAYDRSSPVQEPASRWLMEALQGGGPSMQARREDVESITSRTPFFAANDFYEVEVAHRVERFGNIAHVWSTYEGRRSMDAPPFLRGINSIQLFHDGDRWWVMSVMWDNERPESPLTF